MHTRVLPCARTHGTPCAQTRAAAGEAVRRAAPRRWRTVAAQPAACGAHTVRSAECERGRALTAAKERVRRELEAEHHRAAQKEQLIAELSASLEPRRIHEHGARGPDEVPLARACARLRKQCARNTRAHTQRTHA